MPKNKSKKRKQETLTEEDSLQLKKELLLWEFNRLDSGDNASFQQIWRARFLLATMSVAFLGLCATGTLKHSWEKEAMFYIPFAFVFIFLFYFYDCHVNHVSKTTSRRKKRLRKVLWNLPDHTYSQLREVFSKFLHDIREEELKTKYYGSRWRRLRNKLGLGFKVKDELELFLFYSIIFLMWAMGFIILSGVSKKVGCLFSEILNHLSK